MVTQSIFVFGNLHNLPPRLKSTVFEIFSNVAPKGSLKYQKTLTAVVHTISIYTQLQNSQYFHVNFSYIFGAYLFYFGLNFVEKVCINFTEFFYILFLKYFWGLFFLPITSIIVQGNIKTIISPFFSL